MHNLCCCCQFVVTVVMHQSSQIKKNIKLDGIEITHYLPLQLGSSYFDALSKNFMFNDDCLKIDLRLQVFVLNNFVRPLFVDSFIVHCERLH